MNRQSLCYGHRFPPEIISDTVCIYHILGNMNAKCEDSDHSDRHSNLSPYTAKFITYLTLAATYCKRTTIACSVLGHVLCGKKRWGVPIANGGDSVRAFIISLSTSWQSLNRIVFRPVEIRPTHCSGIRKKDQEQLWQIFAQYAQSVKPLWAC